MGCELAGAAAWEGDGSTFPVTPAAPAGYSREDAERDGLIVPENATDAERGLIALRRVRATLRWARLPAETWRAWLRETELAWAAELEEWDTPPGLPAASSVPFDIAAQLVADGHAEWVEPDLGDLEQHVERWAADLGSE